MNYKFLSITVASLIFAGCENYSISINANSESEKESVETPVKVVNTTKTTESENKYTNVLNNSIQNSHSIISKYEATIEKVKKALIKLKISRKVYQNKFEKKERTLALAKLDKEISPEKIAIMESSVSDMKSLVEQIQAEEDKLQNTLIKFHENIDVIKMKIDMLKSKKEILAIKKSVSEFEDIDLTVKGVDDILANYTDQLNREIIELETIMEVEALVK